MKAPNAKIANFPVSVGGWNTADAPDRMKPHYATVMDNLFPGETEVRTRKGHVVYASTGNASPVHTLMNYSGATYNELIAAAGGSLYTVTGGVSALLAAGYTSGARWSSANFSNAAGVFLLACNTGSAGADVPIYYTGTTGVFANVVFAGIPPPAATDLIQVMVYQQRVYWVERNSLSVWYTVAGAFGGTLTKFDFGSVCSKGGSIASITTWTRDNGAGGADDLFVVVTTRGQVLLYSGIDPSTVFVMVGRFDLGEPVSGMDCMVRTGPDVLLLGADGYQPLSAYLRYGSTRADTTNLARKIGNAAAEAVAAYGHLPGWQGIIYPKGTALIINVPISTADFQQHVVNTTTGAWCRYTGMVAYCWGLYDNNLYFGGSGGVVYRADSGATDNGFALAWHLQPAYQPVSGVAVRKKAGMMNTNLSANGAFTYHAELLTDFAVSYETSITTSSPVAGVERLISDWNVVSGIGYYFAPHLRGASTTLSVAILDTKLTYQPGGIL